MRSLIINADDLGYSIVVNHEIERCIQKKVITSSTIMANAPAFEDGVRIAQENPQISVGVHLNLVEFSPLTNAEIFKKHNIVGADGNFIEGAIFIAHVDKELEQAVFEEWDAQIAKVINAGLSPSHIDSHEHTHTISSLQTVLLRVMDKYNINKVRRKLIPSIRLMLHNRRHKNVIVKYDKSKAVKSPKRNFISRKFHIFVVKYENAKWNRYMKKSNRITDFFYAFRTFYFTRSLISLGGSDSVIELMCHPGQSAFQFETDILLKDMSWLPNNYRLINYKEL